jgi:hypothetical protein
MPRGRAARCLVLLAFLSAAQAQDRKDCGPDCFGSKRNKVCSFTRDCFFPGCKCEYRGSQSGCVASGTCVGWKTTSGCDPDGNRKPQDDRDCCAYVPMAWSGYCECAGGHRVAAKRCNDPSSGSNIVCQDKCDEITCIGSWGAWGSCSVSCGAGIQSRAYRIISPGDARGQPCAAVDGQTETRACDEIPCPVDCVGTFSECSAECESTFTVVTAAAHSGAPCVTTKVCRTREGGCVRGETVGATLQLAMNISQIMPKGSDAFKAFTTLFVNDVRGASLLLACLPACLLA